MQAPSSVTVWPPVSTQAWALGMRCDLWRQRQPRFALALTFTLALAFAASSAPRSRLRLLRCDGARRDGDEHTQTEGGVNAARAGDNRSGAAAAHDMCHPAEAKPTAPATFRHSPAAARTHRDALSLLEM
jgi:hypothetical protein